MTPARTQLVPTCGRNRPRWRQRIILTAPTATPRPPSAPPDSPQIALHPPRPPSPTRPRMAADSTRPHPALTATALGYRERKGEDALPLPGHLLKPRPSQRATARAEGQKPEGRTRSGAALSCWVLHPAGCADLVGGCCYVVNRAADGCGMGTRWQHRGLNAAQPWKQRYPFQLEQAGKRLLSASLLWSSPIRDMKDEDRGGSSSAVPLSHPRGGEESLMMTRLWACSCLSPPFAQIFGTPSAGQ
ncbi:uncharacterized protein LOC122167900 [Centrocercus urophasianus]|uniref:uncharacterized protein LOC122167900 n=1 Tax=Centrocercus urophasianus TaxID=9002 RepID=UPI001C64DD43|nr:uncharacterized protein LOC122167900 [Centrocercus urophasianus]